MNGRWAKGRAAVADEEKEHAKGEGPSLPMPRQSPIDHLFLEPQVGPSVRVPPSSRTVPSFSLQDEDMGLLAERVAKILSVQQQRFQE